jgi:hypothetical protein
MSETLQSILKAVDSVADGDRSNAIDLINDVMLAKSSEVIDAYKQVVANTIYDEIMDNISTQETEE